MSSLANDNRPRAVQVRVSTGSLTVTLSDGRIISAPLNWYPRLQHATPRERTTWTLIGGGSGIHWPKLDEDISVENLLNGSASRECDASLAIWLKQRSARRHASARRRAAAGR